MLLPKKTRFFMIAAAECGSVFFIRRYIFYSYCQRFMLL